MAKYVTHTSPALTLEMSRHDLIYRVTITGDRTKLLYEGRDAARALEVYDYTKEHYEQRRLALELDGEEAEREVPYTLAGN